MSDIQQKKRLCPLIPPSLLSRCHLSPCSHAIFHARMRGERSRSLAAAERRPCSAEFCMIFTGTADVAWDIGPRASGFRVALIDLLYLTGNIALFPCQSCDAVAHWHIALWRPICWADSHFYSSRFAVPRLCSTTAQLTSQGLIFLQDMCHRSSCFQLCQKNKT